jgi:hypothetical protein
MCPFLGLGKTGKPITGATDGETIGIWCAGHLGPFREWSSLADPLCPSPLAPFRALAKSTPTYPLALARKSRHHGAWTVDIGGHLGVIPPTLYSVLSCLDACYLGASAATPDAHSRHPAITLRGTCGGVLFAGALICPTS